MKKLNLFDLSIVAIALCGIVNSASAQTTGTNPIAYRVLPIHHVRSDIMASWLDPTHHHAPTKFKEQSAANPSAISTFHVAPEPALESGKATIISIVGPHNQLLVCSDQTLFDHLKQEVDVLDKPIPGIDSAANFPEQDISTGNDVPINVSSASKHDVHSEIDANSSNQQWHSIPIQNIRPDILAYWIDPAHHTKPVEYQQADNYMRQSLSPKQMVAPAKTTSDESSSTNVLESPRGVSSIFADDANNVLWVRATEDGFDQLKQIVEFLDQPIRKIDFDIKLIQLNSVDAASLQGDLRLKLPIEPDAQHGNLIVNQNLKSTLAKLIKTGDAKVIKSSQLVLQNNLTDRYTTSTFTPVTVDIKQADNGNQIATTQDNPLFMERRFSLVLTPTINNDNTITIFNSASIHAELTYQQSPANDDLLRVQSLDNQNGMTTVCTLKNGDSMIFTGYNSTMLGIDNENHPIVLWVKAQIEK
jgi:hypothetical protein